MLPFPFTLSLSLIYPPGSALDLLHGAKACLWAAGLWGLGCGVGGRREAGPGGASVNQRASLDHALQGRQRMSFHPIWILRSQFPQKTVGQQVLSISLDLSYSHQKLMGMHFVSELVPRPAQGLLGSLTGHIEVDEPLVPAHFVGDHTFVHGRHISILDHQLAHRLGRKQACGSFLGGPPTDRAVCPHRLWESGGSGPDMTEALSQDWEGKALKQQRAGCLGQQLDRCKGATDGQLTQAVGEVAGQPDEDQRGL